MVCDSSAPPASNHCEWDAIFRRQVALKAIPEDWLVAEASGGFLQLWERWSAAPHHGLLRAGDLDVATNTFTREWAVGFSLLELLRHRRKLPTDEALTMALELAKVLDHAEVHGLLEGYGMDKIFVDFGPEPTAGEHQRLLDVPARDWPHWALRMDPVRLATLGAGAVSATTPGGTIPPAGIRAAIVAVHRITREMLGGAKTRPGVPLASLNGPANALFAKALCEDAWKSAWAFTNDLWAAAEVAPLPRAPRPRVEYLLNGSFPEHATATLLALIPENDLAQKLALNTGDTLTFGRSSAASDFVVRFADGIADAVEMTKMIGRQHCTLRLEDHVLRLRDGSDGQPSHNGTFTSCGPVNPDGGFAFRGRAVLQLAGRWRATLLPTPPPAEDVSFREEIETAWRHADPANGDHRGEWGAVFIRPWRDCAALYDTVWMLTEAGFSVDVEGRLVWDAEALGLPPAAFHFQKGSFFVLNRRLGADDLAVDGRAVVRGGAAVLADEATLRIGGAHWKVRAK